MNERISPQSGKLLRRGVRPLNVTYKGFSATVDVAGWYGDDPDDSIHTGEDMKPATQALNGLKARAEGLLDADAVRRVRKKLKLTQKDASRLIGGGPNAFQRYESGDILVSQAMSNLLRLLDRDPSLLTILGDRNRKSDAA